LGLVDGGLPGRLRRLVMNSSNSCFAVVIVFTCKSHVVLVQRARLCGVLGVFLTYVKYGVPVGNGVKQAFDSKAVSGGPNDIWVSQLNQFLDLMCELTYILPLREAKLRESLFMDFNQLGRSEPTKQSLFYIRKTSGDRIVEFSQYAPSRTVEGTKEGGRFFSFSPPISE